jgi:hypothetical protein
LGDLLQQRIIADMATNPYDQKDSKGNPESTQLGGFGDESYRAPVFSFLLWFLPQPTVPL